MGLPRWHSGQESSCQCRRCRRLRFDPWVWKIPWSRKWQHILVLPGKFHGQRSLEGYGPQSHKNSDTTRWLSAHTGNATVAFKIATLLFSSFKKSILIILKIDNLFLNFFGKAYIFSRTLFLSLIWLLLFGKNYPTPNTHTHS